MQRNACRTRLPLDRLYRLHYRTRYAGGHGSQTPLAAERKYSRPRRTQSADKQVWQKSIRDSAAHHTDPFADPVGSYNGPTVGIASDVEQGDPISKP
jgi:hypothetical protein